MKEGPDISHIAALIGDPARANMLSALMTGKALTATELAHQAGVSKQTASSHLGKLTQGGLITASAEGRHRYYALSSSDVGHVLEALMGLAAGTGHLRKPAGPRDPALRFARVCYNHLAGDMGVRLLDSMLARSLLTSGTQLTLTPAGQSFLSELGVLIAPAAGSRAPLCRPCLDWSARRAHLAGQLGRALLSRFEDLTWLHRVPDTRIIRFTATGQSAFETAFPLP